MCWTWAITEAKLFNPQGEVAGEGYAGNGDCLNRADRTNVKDRGPLPCGDYKILDPVDDPHVGKYALYLVPDPSNTMYGRGLFRIHGDNAGKAPLSSSSGCVIINKIVRLRIGMSADRVLRVVPTMPITEPNPAARDGQISLVV